MPRWQRKETGKEASDRFISNHPGIQQCNPFDENIPKGARENDGSSDYNKLLSSTVQGDGVNGTQILSLQNKAPAPREYHQNSLKILYSQQIGKKV